MTTPITRRARSWMPLLACLLGIGIATPEAKASFVLEYTGKPLSNSGVNCGLQTCLTGNITVEFHVLASAIPSSGPFCLALGTLGTTSNDCLAVDFALVRNGSNTLLLEGDPSNFATFDLKPASPSWVVSLVEFSNLDPAGSQLLLMKSATAGSEFLQYGQAVGHNNKSGTWSVLATTDQAVPEPATWTAIATGLGLTSLVKRRRS